VANEANVDPAPAVVPDDRPSADKLPLAESLTFAGDIAFLRGRGCRCMLSWNGVMSQPYTVCEETGRSGLCPKRLIPQE